MAEQGCESYRAESRATILCYWECLTAVLAVSGLEDGARFVIFQTKQLAFLCILMVIYIHVIDRCGGDSEAYFAR